MNWIDYVLIALLLVAIFIGSKRGLFSGIMGLIGLFLGVIVSVNYIDIVTLRVLSHMKVSPVVVSFFSLIFLFAIVYFAVKIIAFLFYKVASLNPLGKMDKFGGAIFGLFQGWVVLGFVLILLIFPPLPLSLTNKIDTSFLGPLIRGSVPLIYQESSFLHPQNTSFVEKLKIALKQESPEEAKSPWEAMGRTPPKRTNRAEIIAQDLDGYFGKEIK
ncbi:MAG: CvpA family protein [candidate division Zixibacteria bacterium]|nr:CvpA family protein [candidate division Zixibacteria bacterium]